MRSKPCLRHPMSFKGWCPELEEINKVRKVTRCLVCGWIIVDRLNIGMDAESN